MPRLDAGANNTDMIMTPRSNPDGPEPDRGAMWEKPAPDHEWLSVRGAEARTGIPAARLRALLRRGLLGLRWSRHAYEGLYLELPVAFDRDAFFEEDPERWHVAFGSWEPSFKALAKRLGPRRVRSATDLGLASGGLLSTWVYLVRGAEAVKIGLTIDADPLNRLAALQTGSPVPLQLIGLIQGNETHERELHSRFAQFRLHGEWFSGAGLAPTLSEWFGEEGAWNPPTKVEESLMRLQEELERLRSADRRHESERRDWSSRLGKAYYKLGGMRLFVHGTRGEGLLADVMELIGYPPSAISWPWTPDWRAQVSFFCPEALSDESTSKPPSSSP